MNVLQMQFLDISVKERQTEKRGVSGKKAKRGRDEVEVCDSVTHNELLNVNCQMIS